jgi:hypothetical protein
MALNRQTQRRLAVGANATLVSAIVIAALAVGYLLVDRFRARMDLSADQGSVLADDTLQKLRVLAAEPSPVVITAFSAQRGKAESDLKDRQVRYLLEEIDHASPVVEVKFVDFDKERLTAEALGVTDYGSIVVQRGDRRVDLTDRDLFRRVGKGESRRLEFMGEAALARGFAQLMTDARRVVYALVGHGELDPKGRGADGLSELVTALRQDHYAVEPLDLVRDRPDGEAPRVPADAAALLVLRPRTAIPATEEDVLLGYLASGGSVLVAVEPGSPPPGLLGRLGVEVLDGTVLDTMLVFPHPDRPVPRYRAHPVTQDLSDQSLVTLLARVAPLQAAVPAREGVRASTLLETSRDGWIERGGDPSVAASYDAGLDVAGPVSMALALEVGADSGLARTPARVIVVGDADVFSNNLVAEGPGNATFALNALRWLVGDEDRLSVVGRPAASRRMAITAADLERIRTLALALGPVLAVLAGVAVQLSRRGR